MSLFRRDDGFTVIELVMVAALSMVILASVLSLLDGCHVLAQPEGLWADAGDLGHELRKRGVTSKTLDLLIATYALSHSAALLTTDRDFAAMQKAGVPLSLV